MSFDCVIIKKQHLLLPSRALAQEMFYVLHIKENIIICKN